MDISAIYNYHIYKDRLELISPGSVMTIASTEDIKDIKRWIREADKFTPHNTDYRDRICSYLEYQITNEW